MGATALLLLALASCQGGSCGPAARETTCTNAQTTLARLRQGPAPRARDDAIELFRHRECFFARGPLHAAAPDVEALASHPDSLIRAAALAALYDQRRVPIPRGDGRVRNPNGMRELTGLLATLNDAHEIHAKLGFLAALPVPEPQQRVAVQAVDRLLRGLSEPAAHAALEVLAAWNGYDASRALLRAVTNAAVLPPIRLRAVQSLADLGWALHAAPLEAYLTAEGLAATPSAAAVPATSPAAAQFDLAVRIKAATAALRADRDAATRKAEAAMAGATAGQSCTARALSAREITLLAGWPRPGPIFTQGNAVACLLDMIETHRHKPLAAPLLRDLHRATAGASNGGPTFAKARERLRLWRLDLRNFTAD